MSGAMTYKMKNTMKHRNPGTPTDSDVGSYEDEN